MYTMAGTKLTWIFFINYYRIINMINNCDIDLLFDCHECCSFDTVKYLLFFFFLNLYHTEIGCVENSLETLFWLTSRTATVFREDQFRLQWLSTSRTNENIEKMKWVNDAPSHNSPTRFVTKIFRIGNYCIK